MRRATLVLLTALITCFSPAQQVDSKMVAGMSWRLIGPFRGGRSLACTGVAGNANTFYAGECGGGLWKTEDAGTTWKCVTDGFLGSSSVGAVAVSASQPNVVYLGTGEKDIRGDISEGDGVYKSLDGGKTWACVGLRDTRTVSRIVIDPQNPDIVWVAALGHIYGKNTERGVFKTTDGGKTWRKVLYESDRAGAVDLAIDPKDPRTLYAATWEAWRTAYHLNSGGPGSKVWKSTDGGSTWNDISRSPGLPKGVIGKIGLSVSPVDPQRVYALVEADDGGLFRSDDAGHTWNLVNDDREYRQRAWYFSRVVADTQDKDAVYVLNLSVSRSKNAGKSFSALGSRHGDEHDLWIDPTDSKRMVNSDDGGVTVSVDGGRSWSEEDLPTAQFYHVATDSAYPYHILGAQQDSSTVRILSRGGPRGIGPTDWTATAGGESGFVVAKPNDPDVVYGGSYGGEIGMMNHRTSEYRSIDPWPDNPMGHAAIDLKDRFQWTFPIMVSRHDPNVLYTCSQHVHKSTDGGESWVEVSPDLTRNDPSTLQSSGGPITQDNTSVEYYGTVFTLAESPKKKGVLWAGSDDGLVHVTVDGGGHWQDVTPRLMPHWGLCSMIDASPHAEGRAFLAVDNHENDDYAPYAYRTDDFGKTWKPIVTGLPINTFVRVVREDPVRPNLLYCGTETGVFFSVDGGDHWQTLQLNLPLCPVHDLTIKDDDLIAATHGRSFWALDDLASLRQMPEAPKNGPVLFRPKNAFRSGRTFGFGRRATSTQDGEYGENPPTGIIVDVYFPKSVEKSTVKVLDHDGTVVGTAEGLPGSAGFHRTTVGGLRYPGYRGFPGMILWAGRSGSLPAPCGDYTVQLTVDGQTLTQPVHIGLDPNSSSTEQATQEQFALAKRIAARITEANDAVVVARDVVKEVDAAVKEKPELGADAEKVRVAFRAVEEAIYQTKIKAGEDPLNFPIRLNDKLAGVLGSTLSGDFRPTKQCYAVFDELSRELQPHLDALRSALSHELAAFNAKLKAAGGSEITPVDPSKSG